LRRRRVEIRARHPQAREVLDALDLCIVKRCNVDANPSQRRALDTAATDVLAKLIARDGIQPCPLLLSAMTPKPMAARQRLREGLRQQVQSDLRVVGAARKEPQERLGIGGIDRRESISILARQRHEARPRGPAKRRRTVAAWVTGVNASSSSWINLVERWFAELTTKRLQRGAHRSTRALNANIRAWIQTWNDDPKPYIWTKTADEILDSISRYCTRHNSTTN
jgi:hypothetical protein